MHVVGTTKARNCCVFHWRQAEASRVRVVSLRGYHCDPCVRELDQVAKLQRVVLSGSVRMDRRVALRCVSGGHTSVAGDGLPGNRFAIHV